MQWIKAKDEDGCKVWANLEVMKEVGISGNDSDGDCTVYAVTVKGYEYKLFEGSTQDCQDFLQTIVRPKQVRRVSNANKKKR